MKNSANNTLEAYMNLAAAILNSGIKQNDTTFLQSAWFRELKQYVGDYFITDKNKSSQVKVRGNHIQEDSQ